MPDCPHSLLAGQIAEVIAKQAAAEGVMTALIACLLSKSGGGLATIDSVRRSIRSTSRATSAEDAEIMLLRTEQHVADLLDGVERLLRG